MLSLHSSWKVNAVLLVLRRLGVRRELGVGPVQDQATKGPASCHPRRCRCSSASGVESLTALNLLSARFFVEKAFFDWYHTLLSSATISKWIAGFARHQSGPRERWRTMASSTRIECNPGAAFLPPPRGVLSTLPSSLRNPWGVPREASKDCFLTQNRVCFQVNGVVFRSMIRERVLP